MSLPETFLALMNENMIGSLSFINLRKPVFANSNVATPVFEIQPSERMVGLSNLPELSPRVQPGESKEMRFAVKTFQI